MPAGDRAGAEVVRAPTDLASWDGLLVNGHDVGAAGRAEARARVARLRAQEAAEVHARAQARQRARTRQRGRKASRGRLEAATGTEAGWAALWRAVQTVEAETMPWRGRDGRGIMVAAGRQGHTIRR